jgi:hypothetical protein
LASPSPMRFREPTLLHRRGCSRPATGDELGSGVGLASRFNHARADRPDMPQRPPRCRA